MSSKLIRGTFILTLGTFISKFLGLFYVIPFYSIVGKEGTTLYQYSYVPYTIFLSIATAGIPLSVSKFIAKYNALEEYAVGRKLFKSSQFIMFLTGFISFLIMFLCAPMLADMFIVDENLKSDPEDVVTVIRAVSFALIIIPQMSVMRGFFQGHQKMAPTAVSQVIEQIVRIIFLLIGAYVVLNVFNGSLSTAISAATFAAFVGGLGGILVLLWYWKKERPYLNELLKRDKGTVNISLVEIYKEIILYSIPFVFVGIAIPLFQFIDQATFSRAMVSIGLAKIAEDALSILNVQANKLVIIPVSLATAFSLTLVPSITKTFTERDSNGLSQQLNQTFQVLLFLTVPASIGLSLLAEPIYTLFYEADSLGSQLLQLYAPVAILFALFSVTAAILQGINQQRYTVLSLLVGILLKLSLNIPLIKIFEAPGAILATSIGYGAAVFINLLVIKHFAKYKYRLVIRRTLLIVILTAIMFVCTKGLYELLQLFLSPTAKLDSLILVIICALFGAGVYFYLGQRSKLLYFLFGPINLKGFHLKKKLKLRN